MGWWACWGGLDGGAVKSVRVDDDTHDQLAQIATDEDRPMSRIVRAAVDDYEQRKLARVSLPPLPIARRVPDQGPGGESAPMSSGTGELGGPELRSPQEPVACTHPKDLRQKHTWGTTCGDCGRKVT